MRWYEKIKSFAKREWPLLSILVLAFLLRVVGVGYGLPLTVVNDETHFTFAALQMMQSQTLIPALQPEFFQSILPYPVYLSYILLIPFVLILGFKFLLWQGSTAMLQAHLLTDLSVFFITARLFSVLLGVLSVYLVYRISEAVFRSRVAAAAAAFLLSTSLLHVALSMVGRNWMPISFIFLLVLYVLTKSDLGVRRRYLLVFIIAGIGMGISSFVVLALVMAGIFYLLFDSAGLRRIRQDLPLMGLSALIFLALAVIPNFLWRSGNTFTKDISIYNSKSLVGFLSSPLETLSQLAYSETVLMSLFVVGAILLFRQHRRWVAFLTSWFLLYSFIFYYAFRFEPRFFLPLVPIFAIAGGYALSQLWGRRAASVLALVLLSIPLFAALRLSQLSLQGDTREQARAWALRHLASDDKLLVYSSALHIPTDAAAVEELRAIDPNALRKIDDADATLDRKDNFHVLNNLTSLIDTPFMVDLPTYARDQGYAHFLLEPRSLVGAGATTTAALNSLVSRGNLVARFDGFDARMSIWESAFLDSFMRLFTDKMLGPDIFIYELHN